MNRICLVGVFLMLLNIILIFSIQFDEKLADGFKDTDYFKFYNGLINNERLLSVMREKGYKGLFCLHPIFMKQSVDFEQNDVFFRKRI